MSEDPDNETRGPMLVTAGDSPHKPDRASMISNSSSQNVMFAMGLSDNLMNECRKLKASNARKNAKLEQLEKENEQLNQKIKQIKEQYEIIQSSNSVNQDLLHQTQTITEHYNNSQTEISSLQKTIADNSEKLEFMENPAFFSSMAASQGYILIDSKKILGNNKNVSNNSFKDGDYVMLTKLEYDNLVSSNSQNIDTQQLLLLCQKFNLVPIPNDKYEDMIKKPDEAQVNTLASDLGLITLKREDYDIMKTQIDMPSEEAINKFADSHNLALIRKEKYKAMLSEAENISKHKLEKQAEKLDMVVVPKEQYQTLLEGNEQRNMSAAPVSSSKVLANKQYFEQVIRRENEQQEKILTSTKSLGFVTLSNQEYRKLKDNQKDRVLTKTDIYNGAKEYELTVLPTEEYKALLKRKGMINSLTYDDLQQFAARFDMKLTPLDIHQEFSQPKKLYNEDRMSVSLSNILSNANSSVLSLESTNTQGTVYYDAKNLLSLDRFSLNLSKASMHNEAILDYSERRSDEDDAISQISTIHETKENDDRALSSLKMLRKELNGYGYDVITTKHTDTTNEEEENFQDDNSDDDDTNVKHDSMDVETVPELLNTIKSNKHISMPRNYNSVDASIQTETVISEDDAENISSIIDVPSLQVEASKIGMMLISEDNLAKLQRIAEAANSPEFLEECAKKLEYVVIPQYEYDELEEKIETANHLTQDELEVLAEPLGLKVIPTADFEDWKAKQEIIENLTEDKLKVLAEPFNLDVLPAEDIATWKQDLFAAQLSKENISQRALELGYVALPKSEFEGLKQQIENAKRELTEDELKAKASNMGLVAVPLPEYESISKQYSRYQSLTKEDIQRRAPELGLTILENSDFEDIKQALDKPFFLDKDNLEEHAIKLGLVTLSQQDYEQLLASQRQRNDLVLVDQRINTIPVQEKLGKEELSTIAAAPNLRIVDTAILARNAPNNKEEVLSSLTTEDIMDKAKDLDLVTVPSKAWEAVQAQLSLSSMLNKDSIKLKAAELGLVIMDADEYKILQDNVDKYKHLKEEQSQNSLLDRKTLQEEAERQNLLCVPKDSFVVTSYAAKPENTDVVVIPSDYYKQLLTNTSQTRKEIVIPKSSKKAVVNDGSSFIFTPPPPLGGFHHARGKSEDSVDSGSKSIKNISASGAISIAGSNSIDGIVSLATIASLNEPSIIPALTQTVIGEFLHKYYRRLGPLGADSRHERYFWIHPYTLTLYWCNANPVMKKGNPNGETNVSGNNNSSSNRAKSLAIVKVESVTDNNPYPPGLYHKSIIVTSVDSGKSVKFTCPTRQRHNIWFNSLRYLIQRNMEGISLEGIADDPSDRMYSGKIFPLPGEDTKIANARLSRSRRVNKSAPTTLRMASRSTFSREVRNISK